MTTFYIRNRRPSGGRRLTERARRSEEVLDRRLELLVAVSDDAVPDPALPIDQEREGAAGAGDPRDARGRIVRGVIAGDGQERIRLGELQEGPFVLIGDGD